jgi:hypothetical protein
MKTSAIDSNSHRAIGRTRRSWSVAVTSMSLCFALACGVDSPDDGDDVSSQSQALTGDCLIRRPYGWHVIFQCSEAVSERTTTVHPGQSITVFAGGGFHGDGSVTLRCHANGDGNWDELAKSCKRGNNN